MSDHFAGTRIIVVRYRYIGSVKQKNEELSILIGTGLQNNVQETATESHHGICLINIINN